MPADVQRGATVAVTVAWVMAAVAVAATVLAATLLGAAGTGQLPWKQLVVTAAWSLPGALMASGRPRIAVGWLLLAAALLFAGSGLGQAWTAYAVATGRSEGLAWAVWFTDRFSAWLVVCGLVALVLVPDGRLPARWWRPVLAIVVSVQSLVLTVFVLAAGPAAGPDSDVPAHLQVLTNPVGILPEGLGEAIQDFGTPVLQGPLLLIPLAVLTRLLVAGSGERRRLVAVLLAVTVFALLVVVGHAFWPGAADLLDVVGSLVVAVVLTTAVLRRRLDQVEVVLHHTIVHVTLTALIGGAFVLVTSLATMPARALPPFGVGALAAALALGLLPMRTWLQQAVRRLSYGDRSDPYAAVERLTERTRGARDLEAVLAEIASSLVTSLRVQWAGVTVGDLDVEVGLRPGAGAPTDAPLRRGQDILGTLTVRGGPGRRLTADDQRLLETLGMHAGTAVHAVLLAEELRSSRQRTVLSREEERRRVGRDLHDGLGPTLAGLAMQLGAVRGIVTSDPELAARRLEVLERSARDALAGVRRVARGLRLPALDQLGLVDSLRQVGQALGVDLTVSAEPVTILPPAVETAAYLIAAEAVTNVARHTGAREAVLSVAVSHGELRLSVVDPGPATPRAADDGVAGVGITGMRERAAELGGSVVVAASPGGGTAVTARFPLTTANASVRASWSTS